MRFQSALIVLLLLLSGCETRAPAPAVEATPCDAGSTEAADTGPIRVLLLGDRTGRANDSIFYKALKEGAVLRPDLILTVGDLIGGYQPDDRMDEADAQWDHVLGMIGKHFGNTPLYTTAGNHDIWSESSEALFAKRIGHPPNHAFDLGDARIIIFDSSRVHSESELEEESLNWLADALFEARDHANRIVVTHMPLWAKEGGGAYGSPLHDVFIAGNADWVLTGHWHHSMSDDRDGIKYRMLGPSGTTPHREGHPESGNFSTFGLMTIDGDDVEISLVPVGAITPSDAFPYEMNQLEWAIENRAVEADLFFFDVTNPPRSGRFELKVSNVTDVPLRSDLRFKGAGWTFRSDKERIELFRGDNETVTIRFTRDKDTPIFPGPRLELAFPWPEDRTYLLDKALTPTLVYTVTKTGIAPDVDGATDEPVWRAASHMGPLITGEGRPVSGRVEAQAIQSGPSLFIAVRVNHSQDPDFSPRDDRVSILFNPRFDNLQFASMVTFDPEGNLTVSRIDLLSSVVTKTDTAPIEAFAVKRDETSWTIEVSIPHAQLFQDDLGLIPFNIGITNEESHHGPLAWQPLLEHNRPSFGRLRIR